jgi:hypothetical protein
MCSNSATRRSACLSGEECAAGAREHWAERETDEGAFKDARLGRRFTELLKQISDGMGGSIPFACQDWASTKAAYRFFANERVEEGRHSQRSLLGNARSVQRLQGADPARASGV